MSLYFVIVILICLVSGGVLYKTLGANKMSFLASLLIVVSGAFILLDSDDKPAPRKKDNFNARQGSQQVQQAEQEEIDNIIANLATIDESTREHFHVKPSLKDSQDFNPESSILLNGYSDANFNNEGEAQKISKIVPQKNCDDEFDIDVYNGVGDIENIYKKMGTIGDNLICNRMKYMGMQPKLSKDIRAAYNKYSFQPMVEEELREQADKIWWDNDQLDLFT